MQAAASARAASGAAAGPTPALTTCSRRPELSRPHRPAAPCTNPRSLRLGAAPLRPRPPAAAAAGAPAPRGSDRATSCAAAGPGPSSTSDSEAPTEVALFWDLDNLPPDEEPSLVASQLLSIARALGSPARLTLLAAGNPTTFDYRPKWFEPPRLLQAAADGSVRCPLCGRREKSYEAARRHFKVVHEKEREKRSRAGEAPDPAKEAKFLQAQNLVFGSSVRGMGLEEALRGAGFEVAELGGQKQAVDDFLSARARAWLAFHSGGRGGGGGGGGRRKEVEQVGPRLALVLVTDDSDFLPVLREAQARHMAAGARTVVVSSRAAMRAACGPDGLGVPWQDLMLYVPVLERPALADGGAALRGDLGAAAAGGGGGDSVPAQGGDRK